MERRLNLVPRARLLGAVLLILAGATACSGTGPIGRSAAATVNGVDISAGQVAEVVDAQERLLRAQAGGAEKQRAEAETQGQQVQTAEELAAQVEQALGQYRGSGADTIATSGAAQVLTALIGDQLYRDALTSTGGKVTDQLRATARTNLDQRITSLGIKADQVPRVLIDQAVEQAAVQAAIEATAPDSVRNQPVLTDQQYTDQLRGIYEAQVGDLTQLCLNLISTADEASGRAAKQRVEAGEAFADVAADVSSEGRAAAIDGAGACAATADVAGVLGDAAKTAQPGDLLGPAAANDGTVLLAQVDRIQVPTFEEARPQLEQANPNNSGNDASAALQQYVADALAKAGAVARVTVDPRYGTWDPATSAVVPPPDPKAVASSSTAVGAAPTPTPVPDQAPTPAPAPTTGP